jgi:hypothetical protein
MQITFNTEDSVDDLSRIHEILAEAIKKKGGSIKVEQPAQSQFIQPQQIFPQSQPVFQPVQKSSFSDTLNQDRAMSMGLNVPRPQPQPVQQQPQQQFNSEIDRINAEYKRQYIEKKINPEAVSKPSNPDIDMSNIYYSDKRKKF